MSGFDSQHDSDTYRHSCSSRVEQSTFCLAFQLLPPLRNVYISAVWHIPVRDDNRIEYLVLLNEVSGGRGFRIEFTLILSPCIVS